MRAARARGTRQDESADQARLDKVEKCSQEAALSKQRAGHPSSSRPPHPRNPSARCLPGFITAPFITACLDNAVVVPIVPARGDAVVTHIPSPNNSHGENQTCRYTSGILFRARKRNRGNVKRKEGARAVSPFPERPRAPIAYPRSRYYLAGRDRSPARWRDRERRDEVREDATETTGKVSRRQNYGRLIASSRN